MHKLARAGEQEMTAVVEIETPAVLVARPLGNAQRQRERVVAAVVPPMEALAQKAEHLSYKVERQELQIVAQAQLEQMSKALLAHLRQVDLGAVITALGGERDPSARGRWILGGEPISVDGERWYNHAHKQSSAGAIELVQHATGYDYRQAISYLRHQLGADVAVVAAARHAQSIAEREPPPPFQAPGWRENLADASGEVSKAAGRARSARAER